MVHVVDSLNPVIEGEFERKVKEIVNNAFSGHFRDDKFFAISEIARYKPSEDESIWHQRHGRRAEFVEIYQNGTWLCDVHSQMSKDEIVSKVYKALKQRNDSSNNTNT